MFFIFPSSCKVGKGKKITRIGDFVNVLVGSKDDIPEKSLDPELMEYIDSFVKDAAKYGVMIPNSTVDKLVSFKYVDTLTHGGAEGVIAVCNRYYTKKKKLVGLRLETTKSKWLTIEVLRNENFTEGSKMRLKELLYHEIFHCLMNKGHLPEDVDGIMNPVFVRGNRRSEREWDDLVEEMFSPEFLALIPDAP